MLELAASILLALPLLALATRQRWPYLLALLAGMLLAAIARDVAAAHPPGLPHYTHPRSPSARAEAAARVWDVYQAIDVATNDPALRAELRRICRRESACNWIGTVTFHEGDAAGGRARWRAAVRRGLLHPETCPAHELGDPARWTSYGVLGIAAAWTVHYAGECVGPEVLDDPHEAVPAGVRWIESLCRRQGACTCEERTVWWVGPGVFAARSRWSRLGSIARQCGPEAVAWWRWSTAAWLAVPEVLGFA